MTPRTNGVIETALYVQDLQRAGRFYQDLLGLRVLLSDERLTALAVGDRQVLLLFLRGASTRANPAPTGGLIPPHDAAGRIHVGFAIAADELEAWERRLAEFGIEVESRLEGARGGTSVYFRDPDQNLVELLTPGVWAVY
jgi:catechol 2,3-dioxygenase-like lactoylglutathione lyase family enzyme